MPSKPQALLILWIVSQVPVIISQILPNDGSISKDLLVIRKINFCGCKWSCHVIGLPEKRWVERYKLYKNYFFLFKFIVATFDSICNPHLYKDFYKYLKNETIKNWYWGSESINKVQSLFAICRKFYHILAYAVLFHDLEPIKPLVTKLSE